VHACASPVHVGFFRHSQTGRGFAAVGLMKGWPVVHPKSRMWWTTDMLALGSTPTSFMGSAGSSTVVQTYLHGRMDAWAHVCRVRSGLRV
jgi:hypothetical protein